jgi:hypothetical protein
VCFDYTYGDRGKKQVVKEAKEIGNLAAVARRYELSANILIFPQ